MQCLLKFKYFLSFRIRMARSGHGWTCDPRAGRRPCSSSWATERLTKFLSIRESGHGEIGFENWRTHWTKPSALPSCLLTDLIRNFILIGDIREAAYIVDLDLGKHVFITKVLVGFNFTAKAGSFKHVLTLFLALIQLCANNYYFKKLHLSVCLAQFIKFFVNCFAACTDYS